MVRDFHYFLTRLQMSEDFIVSDLSLADWGRKELSIAETEMPGLMAVSYTHLTLPTTVFV